jgi:hypothetical protein
MARVERIRGSKVDCWPLRARTVGPILFPLVAHHTGGFFMRYELTDRSGFMVAVVEAERLGGDIETIHARASEAASGRDLRELVAALLVSVLADTPPDNRAGLQWGAFKLLPARVDEPRPYLDSALVITDEVAVMLKPATLVIERLGQLEEVDRRNLFVDLELVTEREIEATANAAPSTAAAGAAVIRLAMKHLMAKPNADRWLENLSSNVDRRLAENRMRRVR